MLKETWKEPKEREYIETCNVYQKKKDVANAKKMAKLKQINKERTRMQNAKKTKQVDKRERRGTQRKINGKKYQQEHLR